MYPEWPVALVKCAPALPFPPFPVRLLKEDGLLIGARRDTFLHWSKFKVLVLNCVESEGVTFDQISLSLNNIGDAMEDITITIIIIIILISIFTTFSMWLSIGFLDKANNSCLIYYSPKQ
ncbi:hypothetical protein CapIbe_000201 [Capra ibex]